MDLNMFFVFPGILITIGAGLLILSIIIVIIAYKTVDKQKLDNLSDIHYESTIKEEGYYDDGKPKIVIEAESVKPVESNVEPLADLNNNLDATKIFKFPVHKQELDKSDDLIKQTPLVIGDFDEVSEMENIDVLEKDFVTFKEKPVEEKKEVLAPQVVEEEEEIELL